MKHIRQSINLMEKQLLSAGFDVRQGCAGQPYALGDIRLRLLQFIPSFGDCASERAIKLHLRHKKTVSQFAVFVNHTNMFA